ncbi:MAG: hypothetical protein ACTSX2_07640 [Candidatus Thorarchaeota archaeon]
MRVRKLETMKGLLFIFFVSLIVRSLLLQRAKEAGLLKKQSVEDILREIGKLRAMRIGEEWRLTEITKNQRTMMKATGILTPLRIGT